MMIDRSDAQRLQHLVRFWQHHSALVLDYGGPLVSVALLSEGLIRIRLAPRGTFAPRRSWAVAPPDDAFAPVDTTLSETSETMTLTSNAWEVQIARQGGRVTIREQGGRTLLHDGRDGGPRWEPDSGSAAWLTQMPPDERYYGFGERTGLLDKRGRRYTCWATDEYEHQGPSTDMLYQAIPFFLALDGDGRSYGLFLNNTHRSAFDMRGEQQHYAIEVAGGELDFYVIRGPEPAQVVERYTALTSRMPLPPRWALGYHHSRWAETSAESMREIAQTFRQRHLPADVLNLDIDYMDGYRIFTWDKHDFPDLAALSSELGELGFKLTAIVDVGVKVDPEGEYAVYQEGVARNYFIKQKREPNADDFVCYVWPGLCAFPDFTRVEVRAWWGSWYRVLLDQGVSGFINDMNEPAMHDRPFDQPGSTRVDPPLDLPHGPPEEPTTHAEVHNVYALLEAQATYTALCQQRPAQRPFLLSRAGYAGVQRYAAIWAGDNASFWEHLEMSLPQLMNMGLSGLAFSGADIGGFFENGNPELYARWMQLGSFYPFARSNTAEGTAFNAPWMWGEQVEAICRRALELRYRLLPYLYTVFEEAARTGAPILRPLFYHYATDTTTHQLHDQALLGRDLLIAPILRAGKTCREVYLPSGRWYDLRTNAGLSGPQHLLADAPLEQTPPLYGRGGAIIPWGPPLEWVGQRPLDPLTLDIFPDAQGEAEGRLYEDDGQSFAYQQGERCVTTYRCWREPERDGWQIEAQREGRYTPARRSVVVRLHDATKRHQRHHPADEGNWRITLP